MRMDESRVPVIVGVGQVNDRPEDDAPGLDSLQLMQAALRAADQDAGGGWLAQLNSLAVVDQISFPQLGDVSAPLAAHFGANPKFCATTRYPSGDRPTVLLNEAANRIRAGEIGCAAIVGGEALRTAARSAKRQDAIRDVSERSAKPLRHRYGLVAPVDVYPLYENATRAAFGQTLAQAQRESAEIWSRLSDLAADNPHAWLRKRLTPEDILAPSPENRPIAFPYTKLMVANAAVNQGAGFIVASLAMAKAMGAADARLIYVGYGAGAHEAPEVLARESYAHSRSLTAAIQKALEFNRLAASELDCVELYSCFPCIPKLARRALDWPLERPVSVFGGLTFGGGPIGNYMSHAVACMVERLRIEGRCGLLFANGGFANTNHAIALWRDPAQAMDVARAFDVQAEADADRSPPPQILESYTGPGSIETYTVHYDRAGEPRFGAIVALTPNRERFLAHVPGDDTDMIAFLTSGATEPVGAAGNAVGGEDGRTLWRHP